MSKTATLSPMRSPRMRTLLRVIGCGLIVVPIFYLLREHLAEMDAAQVAASLRAISLQSIALAGFFTFVSLMAVARYDVLAIRQLGLKVPQKAAINGGFVAVSIGQTLGFGLLVGAICRWRFYRPFGITPTDAGLISGLVTVGFLTGFAVVLALSVLVSPAGLKELTGLSGTALRLIAIAVLALAAGFALVAALRPVVRLGKRVVAMPRLRALKAQIVLAAFDTVPAGIALWVLIPADAAPSLAHVLPVYLAALGLGLISNTPGGLGVLELTCLMALPVLPPEHLVAALIAYRAIYYGVPAVIAAAMLLAREFVAQKPVPEESPPAQSTRAGLATSPRAEAQLARLGDKAFLFSACGQGFLMYQASGNSLIALSDPVAPKALWPELLDRFETEARDQMRAPSFYKCGPELAEMLRTRGQFCTQIAAEGIVDLASYTTSGSAKRELRRKLKAVTDVELIAHPAGAAPLGRYAKINAEWSDVKGGERGFSMGYFCRDYVNEFPSIEARLNGQTVGFLTLWISGDRQEHGLDIMRLSDAAPAGTMHALVHEAIMRAAADGAQRFALTAVPLMMAETPSNVIERVLDYIYREKTNLHGSVGLYRFKNAFRPSWSPRYGAAPNVMAAAIAARDVRTLIDAPKPAPHVARVDDVALESYEPLPVRAG